jgi:HAD superfamily hydrolase (TIGR01509 family)
MKTDRHIKALFFDIGGVLVRIDSSAAIQKLSSRLRVEELTIREAMSPELLENYEKGHLNSNQFYENLLINCDSKQKMGIGEFKKYWQDVLFPNKEMITFLEKATQRLPVWLLSNTNDFHYDMLVEKFAFMNWVNGGTYSFIEGSMKPEPQIYERAIKRSGKLPHNVLFIDDLEKNVIAAREQGLNAIHFLDYPSFQNELKSNYPELESLIEAV